MWHVFECGKLQEFATNSVDKLVTIILSCLSAKICYGSEHDISQKGALLTHKSKLTLGLSWASPLTLLCILPACLPVWFLPVFGFCLPIWDADRAFYPWFGLFSSFNLQRSSALCLLFFTCSLEIPQDFFCYWYSWSLALPPINNLNCICFWLWISSTHDTTGFLSLMVRL